MRPCWSARGYFVGWLWAACTVSRAKVTVDQSDNDTYEKERMHMLIVIDLVGDDDIVKKDDDAKRRADEERRRREAWLEWARQHEQVVPQVIPFDI